MILFEWLAGAQPVSTWLHWGGAVYFGRKAWDCLTSEEFGSLRFNAFAIFAGACVYLLSISGLYHWLPAGHPDRTLCQHLDHAGIFLVIAGSFTPIHCCLFTGILRWGVLTLVWGLGLAGLVLKLLFFNDIPEWLGLGYYLGLGWLGVITSFSLWRRQGFKYIQPLLKGGIFYTLGALIEFANHWIIIPGWVGSHELLHLGVLLGIGFHWGFIVRAMHTVNQPV